MAQHEIELLQNNLELHENRLAIIENDWKLIETLPDKEEYVPSNMDMALMRALISSLEGVIERQNGLLSRNNIELMHLRERIKANSRAAMFYTQIQATCLEHPAIMEAWKEFLMVAKLSEDKIEEKWK